MKHDRYIIYFQRNLTRGYSRINHVKFTPHSALFVFLTASVPFGIVLKFPITRTYFTLIYETLIIFFERFLMIH